MIYTASELRNQMVGGGKRKAYQGQGLHRFAGKGCCGGSGFGQGLFPSAFSIFSSDFYDWLATPFVGHHCPAGQLWDSDKGKCTPYTTRANGGTKPGQGTWAPEIIPHAAKWWVTGGEPAEFQNPLAPVFNFFKKDTSQTPGVPSLLPKVDWVTIGLLGLVGFLIVKKL